MMNRTPTGWVLVIISWMIFFGGLAIGGFYFYANSWKMAGIALAVAIILATALRLLANIGEFLFTISVHTRILSDIFKRLQASDQTLQQISKKIQLADQTLQQINCDSKDINQNLFKLASFLKEIERGLDLKK